MSEYRHVLLLNFHVNLDFAIQHRERGKRINYQNKETGQKDRAEHIDQPCAWRTPYLKGEKLNKSKIASETSTLLGKRSKEKT